MAWPWCRARMPPKCSRRPKSWTTPSTPCCPLSRSSNPSRRPSPNSGGSERHTLRNVIIRQPLPNGRGSAPLMPTPIRAATGVPSGSGAVAGASARSRSDGLDLQHGVGVGREGVAQAARLGGDGALHGGHRGLIEIVLRLEVGTGDFGDGHGAGELLVLEVEIGGDGLVGVSVDGVDDELAVVECGGNV